MSIRENNDNRKYSVERTQVNLAQLKISKNILVIIPS